MNQRAAGIPIPPKMEVYQGVSDASGLWVVTFNTPYSTVPHVNPVMFPPITTEMNCLLTSVSTSGFTCQVFSRALLTVLSINLLSFATTPVVGCNLRAFVIASS